MPVAQLWILVMESYCVLIVRLMTSNCTLAPLFWRSAIQRPFILRAIPMWSSSCSLREREREREREIKRDLFRIS